MRSVGLCLLLAITVWSRKPKHKRGDECDLKDARFGISIPLFETGEDILSLTLTIQLDNTALDGKVCKNGQLVWKPVGHAAKEDISRDITIHKDDVLKGSEIAQKSLFMAFMHNNGLQIEVNFNDRFRIYPAMTSLYSSTNPYRKYKYNVITVCEVLGLCEIAISTVYNEKVKITITLKIEPSSCVLQMEGVTYRNGETFNKELTRHMAIQLQSECDLTGTVIESTKQLSVYSGGIQTVVGEGGKTQTFMGATMPLLEAGKQYVVVASNYSLFGDFIKILTTEDNTILNIHGQEMRMETRSMVIRKRIDRGDTVYVTGNKTILIGQMSCNSLWEPVFNSVPYFKPFSLRTCEPQWLAIFICADTARSGINGYQNMMYEMDMTRLHGTDYMMSTTNQILCELLNQNMVHVVLFDKDSSTYIKTQNEESWDNHPSNTEPWPPETTVSEGTTFVMAVFTLDPEEATHINLLASSNVDTDINENDIEIITYEYGIEMKRENMENKGPNVLYLDLTIDSPESTVMCVQSRVDITLRSIMYTRENNYIAAILNHPVDRLGLKYIIGMFWTESSMSVCTIVAHTSTFVDVMLPDAEYPIRVNFSGAEYTNNMKISSMLRKNTQITLESYQDLTGTLIIAEKPVSVFCGQIHRNGNESDTFVTAEQFPPINTFGKSFSITPIKTTDEDENPLSSDTLFRVIAAQHYTVVIVTYFDETSVYEYLEFPGSYIEQSIDNITEIIASKETLVLQEIIGNDERSLIIVVPNEQADKTYNFATFPKLTHHALEATELFTVGNGNTSAVSLYEEATRPFNSFQLREKSAYKAESSSSFAAYIIEKGGRYGSSAGNMLQSNVCVYGRGDDKDCDGFINEDLCILETYNQDTDVVNLTTPNAGPNVFIQSQADLLEHTIPLSMYGFRINSINSIQCLVKACDNVRIYLTPLMPTRDYIYEIKVTKSQVSIDKIWSDQKKELLSENGKNCLSCSTEIPISIGWKDNSLQVNIPCLGNTGMEVLNQDFDVIHDVFVMTGDGATGDWICDRGGVPSYVGEEEQYLPDFDLDGNLDEDCFQKTPDCGFPEFEHADVEMTDSSASDGSVRQTFYVGSTYMIRCIAGFSHSGSNKTTCLPTGLWSKEFKCIQDTKCSAPPRKENTIETVGIFQSYDPGDVFEYKCENGYALSGNAKIECGNDGQWSDTSVTCSECTCPCNEVPDHVDMTEQTIEEIKNNIRKKILVDKKSVSQWKRKKLSAPDRRFSAKAIGLVGAVFLCMSAMVIIMFDVVSLVNTIRGIGQGLGAFF